MKDGWHIVKGYKVYVENDRILRGIGGTNEFNMHTTYPYCEVKDGWDKCTGVLVSTFRRSEKYVMK